MKKFLLTLLFILFASPIFAQTKPTSKTNLDIKIDTKTTEKSLNNIKTNFTGYIETNLCNTKQKENINLIKDKPFENATCGSKTIGETYNCICDKNNSKYKTFYKSVVAITDFSTLKGTTVNQFQQIKNFYDALDALPPLITSVNKLSEEIKKLIKQDEDDKTARNAAINTLKQKLSNDLAKEIEKEKNLRKENPQIVEDLKNKLKPHTDKDINDYMTDKTNNANDAAQKYVDNVINDLLKKNPNITVEDLEKLYNQNEGKDTSETKITDYNIKTIRDELKNKEQAEKDRQLAELLRLKKEEANLINELGKTKTPAVKVNQINDTNFNDSNTNTKLNNALDKLIEGKSQHPTNSNAETNKVAKTIEEIKADIENTKQNIDKLTDLKNKLEEDKKKLDKKLDDNYKRITDLLHEQNKLECKIFGQIDVIRNRIADYKSLNISGASITCGTDEKEGKLNASKTLNQMFQINSIAEKERWNKCLENKIKLLNENMEKDVGPIDKYIKNNIMNKYPGIENLNCNFKCTNEAKDYDDWYIGENTKPTYKNKNGKTLEEQIKECQLASKENAINNFTCPDNITVDNAKLSSIKAKMKEALNENLNKILEIGNRECSNIQDEIEITKVYTDLIIEINKLKNYCCDGTNYRSGRCGRETNVNGSLGNHKITRSQFNIDPIINIMKSIKNSNMTCPDNEHIINNIYETIQKTIYITAMGNTTNCNQRKKDIIKLYDINNNNNQNTSLNLMFKFCEWSE
ncbi:hypothetical protein HDR59_02155 [bacterium]|nr:hypothetical protein [bacterium]